MLIIPAIDLKQGRCVRLWQGKKERQTIYSEDPLAVARGWVEAGAERLHVVDLDGAWEGRPHHLNLVERMAREIDVPLELGGGIRDFSILSNIFEKGIDYAILGSCALSLEFMERACREFGNRIIASVDTRDHKVVVEGWEKETFIQATDLAKDLARVGVSTLIFTDVTRDGTLRGVNFEAVRNFVKEVGVDVIVSGGISSFEDVKKIARLTNLGVTGMIVGKALYTGEIKLEEAMRFLRSDEPNQEKP
ncbi:MAG: 1-(5-phosphoribosyl)-5-[(5-phosphoribosylamino)methylideneamino]imidazole-4-carboxamide isomerase [bacterium]